MSVTIQPLINIVFDKEGNIVEYDIYPNEEILVGTLVERFKLSERIAKELVDAYMDSYEEGKLTVFQEQLLKAHKEVEEYLNAITREKIRCKNINEALEVISTHNKVRGIQGYFYETGFWRVQVIVKGECVYGVLEVIVEDHITYVDIELPSWW